MSRRGEGFEVERCEYVPAGPGKALVRISGRWPARRERALAAPVLLLDDGARAHRIAPLPAPDAQPPVAGPDPPQWRAAFPVPLDLLRGGQAAFALRAGDVTSELPRPVERSARAAQELARRAEADRAARAEAERRAAAEHAARVQAEARLAQERARLAEVEAHAEALERARAREEAHARAELEARLTEVTGRPTRPERATGRERRAGLIALVVGAASAAALLGGIVKLIIAP